MRLPAQALGPRLEGVRRILVVLVRGGMGDALVSNPVLDALREAYPHARIDMMVRRGALAMVAGHPALAETLVVAEGDLDAPRPFWGWAREVRRRRYDLGLVLWSRLPEAWLLLCAGIRHRVGQDSRLLYSWMYTHRIAVRSERGDDESHWAECQLDYARAVGAHLPSPRPRLFLPDADRQEALALLRERGLERGGYTALHVGRGTPLDRTRLPVAPFARVADALGAAWGRPVVLTGSPAEKDVVEGVREAMRGQEGVSLAGLLTVPQMGAVLEAAALVVANDSGPMHMAGALGVPTIGIFAMEKDLPLRWSPLGDHCIVVRPQRFRCRPQCTKETCPRMDCYQDILPDMVLEAARELGCLPPLPPPGERSTA